MIWVGWLGLEFGMGLYWNCDMGGLGLEFEMGLNWNWTELGWVCD